MVKRGVPVLVLVVVMMGATFAWAQQFFGFGSEGRLPEGLMVPPKYPTQNIEDGNFRVCKLVYTSVRREANGMGWSTDWPYAGIHLMIRAAELSKTRISKDAGPSEQHGLTTALRRPDEEFTSWKRKPHSVGESFLGDRCFSA